MASRQRLVYGCLALACMALAFVAAPGKQAAEAQSEDIVIRSFDANYVVQEDGAFTVVEDLSVDFLSTSHHGILRDIPVSYPYDNKSKRVIRIDSITVDNGQTKVPFSTQSNGPNLELRIGDPNRLVTGLQHYRIQYRVVGGLNAFSDHDELYWNIVGSGWPYTIEKATASVTTPSGAVTQVTCYQGGIGSTQPCTSSSSDSSAQFSATGALGANQGLTVVVGLKKGAVAVAPPLLEPLHKSVGATLQDFFGDSALVYGLTALVALLAAVGIAREWWRDGRDRWYGDNYYLTQDPRERTKPLFAHETIVVEYSPPDLQGTKRPLRPAEIGLLLDEKADTLDVSATIVDLAVRGYLKIEELPAAHGHPDYKLTETHPADDALLPYERDLLTMLFDRTKLAFVSGEGAAETIDLQPTDEAPAVATETATSVKLSELQGVFWMQLASVKMELSEEAVKEKLFPADPEEARSRASVDGLVIAGAAILGGGALGYFLGAALIAVPALLGGILLVALSRTMSRRTGLGREMYRRCLGFRLFLLTAQKDYQKFLEEEGIFDKYLPYAIVFHCVKRWSEAFASLGKAEMNAEWFASPRGLAPLDFALGVGYFSSAVTTTMAATALTGVPGSGSGWAGGFSGFSGGGFSMGGFGGGGFSGGGGGGGGGGAW